MKEKILKLFKTKITAEQGFEAINITDEFSIVKIDTGYGNNYLLHDEISEQNYCIYSGTVEAFDEENIDEFKEFLFEAFDDAFEDRKQAELEKIKF